MGVVTPEGPTSRVLKPLHHTTNDSEAFPWLVPGPVFKTVEGSGNRLLVGSIPIRFRQPSPFD